MPHDHIAADWDRYTTSYTTNAQANSFIDKLNRDIQQELYAQVYRQQQKQTNPLQEMADEIAAIKKENRRLREALKDNDQIILELKETIVTLEEELEWSLNKATVPLD